MHRRSLQQRLTVLSYHKTCGKKSTGVNQVPLLEAKFTIMNEFEAGSKMISSNFNDIYNHIILTM